MALHRFAHNTFFSTVAGCSTALGSFVASVVVARVLGPEGAGAVALALWMVATAVTAGDLGVPLTLSRFLPDLASRGAMAQGVALERALLPALLVTTFGGGLLTAVLYVVAVTTARENIDVLPFHRLVPAIWPALGVVFVAQALGNFVLGRLRGLQRFTVAAKLALASFTLQVVAVAAGGLWFGTVGAVLGFAAGSLVPALLIARRQPASAPLDDALRRRAWRFAFNSWGAGLVSTIVWSRSELAFLSYWRGAHDAGYYAVALTLCQIATQAPLLMTGSLLALFSERQGGADAAGLVRAYGSAVRFMAAMLMPACFGMAAIAPVLLPLFFGPAFVGAVGVASFLIASQAIGSLSTVSTMFLFAAERGSFIVKSGLVGAMLLMVSGVTLIPMFGLFGTAAARAAIQIALTLAAYLYIDRTLHCATPWGTLGRIGAAAAGCALAARAVIVVLPNELGLMVAIIVGMATYGLLIRLCRALPDEDLARLQSLATRLPASVQRQVQAGLCWLAPVRGVVSAK